MIGRMLVSRFLAVSAFMASLLIAGPALAEPPALDDAKEKVKEERRQAKEAKRSGDPDAVASAKKELSQAEQDLKAEKRKQRREHLAAARAKWGDTLKKAGVKQEMNLHAKRIARLKRVETLALVGKKEAIAKRAKAAIDKENARHDKKMQELKAQAPAPAPAHSGGAK